MPPKTSETYKQLREAYSKLEPVPTREERLRDPSPPKAYTDIARFNELADKAREAYLARGGKLLSAEEIQEMLEGNKVPEAL
ncbi:MAG: hypothetical protein RLY93_03910 [Sumerlaeia bacterium]